ncbi:MAG: EF-hand domain-containing protein [Acidobacteria bacterium]|nr:EF-hand domain-containing protein [Acidobacteriota bacterium]
MKARVFAVMTLAALPLGAVGASAEQGRGRNQDQMRFQGMDRNRDGMITRAEWRGSDQSFRQHDWNNDGVLSGDEVRTGALRPGTRDRDNPSRDRQFDDWSVEGFQYLDRNRDGRISRDEWGYDLQSFIRADRNRDNVLTRQEFLSEDQDIDREDRFEYLDTNNNNRIDRTEWHGSTTAFNWLDQNNDGVLSRAEVAGNDTRGDHGDDLFAKLDHNGDGRVTRSEWHEDNASFVRADQNRDNVLTRAEVLGTETSHDDRFEHMDINNNGRIERSEWQGRADGFDTLDRNNDNVVTREEMLGETDTSETQVFATADSNRDNRLSQREWQWSQRVFSQQDTNRDGFVSREEFSSPGERATGTAGYANNRTVNSPVVVQVNATERWVDTGLDTRVGDILRITSTGTVRLSANGNDQAHPGGANRRAEQAPLPFYPAGALIARISNGTPFFIGDGTNVDRVNAAGRLYLSVNDDHLGDNSGTFRVSIVIRPQ